MSSEVYRATFERRDALNRVAGTGEIFGEVDYVLDTLRLQLAVLRELHPGDRLSVHIECDVPADHPLAGIDLTG